LFFAIFPDDTTARRIAQLARHLRNKYRLHGEPLRTKRFHLSLYHLGDYFGLPQDAIARAKEAASAITLAPFEIGCDCVMTFAGRNADPERDNYPCNGRCRRTDGFTAASCRGDEESRNQGSWEHAFHTARHVAV
jgi:hypothetical protein